jgi:hypothetical protein
VSRIHLVDVALHLFAKGFNLVQQGIEAHRCSSSRRWGGRGVWRSVGGALKKENQAVGDTSTKAWLERSNRGSRILTDPLPTVELRVAHAMINTVFQCVNLRLS